MTTSGTRRRVRRGATLLEAIVAVSLLSLIGLAGVGLVRSANQLVGVAEASEVDFDAASNFLNAVSLWSREELDQRLGVREQGEWRLEIQRITPDLYLVALRDSSNTETLLRTGLFHPERRRASP